MDNCFSRNPVYVFKKTIQCGRKTQNSLYSLSQRLAEKRQKYFSEYRKREAKINSDFYFLVFILCICSFNFMKIFSFHITNKYFYCFVNWVLLSSFLVIVFVSHCAHMFSAVESFFLFPVPGFCIFAIECVREPGNHRKF